MKVFDLKDAQRAAIFSNSEASNCLLTNDFRKPIFWTSGEGMKKALWAFSLGVFFLGLIYAIASGF